MLQKYSCNDLKKAKIAEIKYKCILKIGDKNVQK